jgi:tripartite-type tricarboxylate transporter receptor subunit TctC
MRSPARPDTPACPTCRRPPKPVCPGFELEAWVGLFAPAGTPPAVVQALTDKVKAAWAQPEVKATADKAGVELRYLGPDALAALVQRETDYWGQIIRSKKIQLD